MITCPNCGHQVPEGQRFCGNCGFDVQAALSRQQPNPTQPPPPTYGSFLPQTYQQYDFLDAGAPPPRRPPIVPITLLLLGFGLVCLCCGILMGFAIYYLIIENPRPSPSGMLDLARMYLSLMA